MATKFILNDFVSDDIPECFLSNSKIVKQLIINNLDLNAEIKEIKDINLVGVIYRGVLLHEWQVLVEVKNQLLFMHFPIYLPQDEKQAAILCEIHSKANFENILPYTDKDYLLIGGKYPCQLFLGEDNELYLKRIVMFASQVQVQEFLRQTLQRELVTAALVIINKHNFCYKGLQDIGWLINMDGIPSLMSMDRRLFDNSLTFIDNFEKLPMDTIFEMDGQKYVVTEDMDNGEFIARITSRQAREYKKALKTQKSNIIN